MRINRRFFLRATGSMSVFFLSGTISAMTFEAQTGQIASSVDSNLAVEKSIKSHFGSGFRVLSQIQNGDQTLAEIEHLGNHYDIVSFDLLDWQILSSTIK